MKTVLQILAFTLLLFNMDPAIAQHEYYTTNQYTYAMNMSHGGSLFKMDSLGKNVRVLHVFDSTTGGYASGSVIAATNGKIYGLTAYGGAYNSGVLFEYDPVLDSYQVKQNLTEPCYYPLMQASNGKIYYNANYDASSYLTEYDITANTLTHIQYIAYPVVPVGKIVEANGKLYATTALGGTSGYGSIYEYNLSTHAFNYVYSFALATGCYPRQGMVLANNGKLYGTTIHPPGSSSNEGTLFSFDPATHVYTYLLTFPAAIGSSEQLTVAPNGKIYGMGGYGTDIAGNHAGNIYEYSPANNTIRLTHSFGSQSYGGSPVGALYTGSMPYGGLMLASNGNMYGNNQEMSFEYDYLHDTVWPAAVPIPAQSDAYGYFCEICRKPNYKYYNDTALTACLGGPFSFDFHNDNALSAVWRHNGVVVPAQSSPVLHFTSVTAADSGTWACTLSNNCGVTAPRAVHIAISALPYAGVITGPAVVCPGAGITLSSALSGGVWAVSNANASVSAGLVTGIAAGTDTVTYTIPGTCGIPTKVITISPLPGSAGAITGAAAVCAGAVIVLSNTATGGVWSSSATGIATIDNAGTVSGIAVGNAAISYTVSNSCGSNIVSRSVMVNPLPVAGTITGPATICIGSPASMSNAVTGGVWSSSDILTATITTAGVVYGVAAGTAVVSYSYTNSCGTAVAIKPVIIGQVPFAGTITGPATVCTGSTIVLNNVITGGIWSTGSSAIATVDNITPGVVSGQSAGMASIFYTVTNACGTAAASYSITVDPHTLPVVGMITGVSSLCIGAITTLSDTATTGAWYSNNTAIATVSNAGSVTGVAAGSATILYISSNICGSAVATASVTVAAPAGNITGSTALCAGAVTTLSNDAPGGSWSSTSAAIATVSNAGVVTGVSAGNAVISYSVSACGSSVSTATISVLPLPDAGIITGIDSVCEGGMIALTDMVSGGSWSTGSIGLATVDISGRVTGIAAGMAPITYSVTNSCGTDIAVYTVKVLPLSVCSGTLGINTITGAGGLQVYPDPAFGSFYITVSNAADETAQITITNALGQVIKELFVHTNTLSAITIDVPAGVYIVSAATPHNWYETRLVIIK